MDSIGELFDAARRAQARAYAPYSRFKVGAALRTGDGAVFIGCNVENAAYPLGICAESAAITTMVVAGGRGITDIAVVGGNAGPVTPCGACRQRLNEFVLDGARVHLAGPAGLVETVLFADLLPRAFGPRDLPVLNRDDKTT